MAQIVFPFVVRQLSAEDFGLCSQLREKMTT